MVKHGMNGVHFLVFVPSLHLKVAKVEPIILLKQLDEHWLFPFHVGFISAEIVTTDSI